MQILSNTNYDFATVLKRMSYDYICKTLKSYEGKDGSYISRNRIHLIFDPE